MRILFVSNHETQRCGVAEFGRQHVEALEGLGHSVLQWHPKPERHDWPLDLCDEIDVVHVNYHPGTISYLQPPRFRPRVLTAFWHEPGLLGSFGEVDSGFGAEAAPGVNLVVPMPVPDFLPVTYDGNARRKSWLIGVSTLRGQGIPELNSVIRPGYDVLSLSEKWLPTQLEISRLGACDFLVFWYGGANRGQSAAVNMGIAAQRPIILSHNRMFESLKEFDDEFYFVNDLAEGIEMVKWDLKCGTARLPRRAREARLWSKQARRMADLWELAL